MQRLNGVLTLRQLPIQGITVTFGVHGMQALHSPRFILDTDFYLLQGDFRLFDLSVNLLCQTLKSVSTRYGQLRNQLVHVQATTTTYARNMFVLMTQYLNNHNHKQSLNKDVTESLHNASNVTDSPGERVVEGVIPLLEEGHELVPLNVHIVVVELRGQLLLQEACTIQKFLYVSVQALATVLVSQSWWNLLLAESKENIQST